MRASLRGQTDWPLIGTLLTWNMEEEDENRSSAPPPPSLSNGFFWFQSLCFKWQVGGEKKLPKLRSFETVIAAVFLRNWDR